MVSTLGPLVSGEKEIRVKLKSASLRWTQSSPRTGGVLYANASISQRREPAPNEVIALNLTDLIALPAG